MSQTGAVRLNADTANSAETVDNGTNLQTFLAFDFGTKRCGVATGNRLTRTASPQPTIVATASQRLGEVEKCIQAWLPDALVLGVPFYPDGAPHENTVRAQKFARQLRGVFGLPVFEVDERYSTTEANTLGAGSGHFATGGGHSSRVKDADAASACIILEQFLRTLT